MLPNYVEVVLQIYFPFIFIFLFQLHTLNVDIEFLSISR
jgi:hypothetical protein